MTRPGDEFLVGLPPILGNGNVRNLCDLQDACGRLAPRGWATQGEREAEARQVFGFGNGCVFHGRSSFPFSYVSFLCHNPACSHQSFLLDSAYKGRSPQIKQQVIELSLNGSGVRDTARVSGISPTTVINELKKKGACSHL
jgi:hypothetical protein